jgi:hypothetical protein
VIRAGCVLLVENRAADQRLTASVESPGPGERVLDVNEKRSSWRNTRLLASDEIRTEFPEPPSTSASNRDFVE